MNDLIRVNHADLDHAMDVIQQTYSQVREAGDTMEGDLRKSLGDFEGEAQQAYQRSQAKWSATKAEMDMQLEKLRNFVDNSKSAMMDADRRGAAELGL